jgi:cytochrome c-type biogenesis protein CcmH
MFWLIISALCLLAVLFAVWPIFKRAGRLTPMLAGVAVFTVALSAGLYNHVGEPNVPSGRAGGDDLPDMNLVMQALEERLQNNPDDINGWKMLGRSYMTMREPVKAVTAYEKAMELENGEVAQTQVDLALAILARDDSSVIDGRSAALIEGALAIEPNNQPALFYSGTAAASRGDTELAASRWEVLLGLNPPDEIRGILEQRVAEWRGQPVAAADSSPVLPAEHPPIEQSVEAVESVAAVAAAAAPEQALPAADPDAVVTARVALSDTARRALTADANVFLIARDPQQPSPPIAVSRLRVSELPTVVSLGDAQSMVAGRALSGFAEFELLARISLSGGPAAASGDWFGSLIVRPADAKSVNLSIDQQVP